MLRTYTNVQRDPKRNRQTYIQKITNKLTDRCKKIQKHKQSETKRHKYKQKQRQADTKTSRDIDKQTHIHKQAKTEQTHIKTDKT